MPGLPDGAGSRYFGVYPALVTDIVDPQSLGRIQVKFPSLGAAGADVRAWATLLSPYADNDQGLEILPEVDTQVVVAFEAGSLRRPYVLGCSWNGVEQMPEAPGAPNNLRLLKTRSGSLLEFDDTSGAEKVTVSTNSGHKLVMENSPQKITMTHANGCIVEFAASGAITISANSSVDVTAPVLNVHSATANFDGIITCTTVVCSVGVVSPSYTPGAGNIW